MEAQGQSMKTEGGFRQFASYAGMNILAMAGFSCYILADTFFIAQGMAADGLAALNLAIPVFSLIAGCGKLLGMGGAIQYSVLGSQGEQDRANRAFSWSIAAGLAISVLFVLAGLFAAGPLARQLGAEGKVLGMTQSYLRVLLYFSPAFILEGALVCFVRNDGSPQLAMLGTVCGSLANILLDYLLIFPLDMGILGAALATGVSPLAGLAILSLHWRKRRRGLCLRRPVGAPWGRILALGFPSLAAELCSGLAMMAFNLTILRLEGDLGVAVYGVVANLAIVAVAMFDGLAQGMQPLVSRAYGRGKEEQTRRLFLWGLSAALLLAAAMIGAATLGAGPIAGLFNSQRDPELQRMAVQGLRLYFTAMPFAGVNIVAAAYFTATERALPAQVVTLCRGFVLVLPALALLSTWLGLAGVWLAVPAAEALTVLVSAATARRTRVEAGRRNSPPA